MSSQNDFNIRTKVANEIHEKVKQLIVDNLKGIPEPRLSFDPGKIDYIIDNVDTRITRITHSVIDLTIDALWPGIVKLIEVDIREKIRRSL